MGRTRKPSKSQKLKSNSVGFAENRENREDALLLLDKIIKRREKEGYVWVVKGTTKKQIHPDKLKAHLEDGWKKSINKK